MWTLRASNSQGEGNDAVPKVAIGFDPSPRECLKRQHYELGDTMKNGTCPGHHDAVAISFKAGQSSRGGLGVDDGACQTMQSHMSALEPTVAIRTANTHANGVECLCPDQPQSHRVFSPDGAMPCLNAMEKRGGCDSAAICVRTANTHANGQAVAFKLDATASNSMKSANPHSGIHKTEVHCALDTTDPNPTKAQGGMVLATPICFQQNQRCEVRDLGGAAGALQSEPGMKQQNYVAIGIGRDAFNSGKNAQMAQSFSAEVQPPITAKGPGGYAPMADNQRGGCDADA